MKSITPQEVEQQLKEGKQLNIIDVREADEVASGHIPGITHIPLGVLEFRMNELDKNKEYIMVCRSGGRSGQATMFLDNQGYNVTNMTGGMMSWEGDVE